MVMYNNSLQTNAVCNLQITPTTEKLKKGGEKNLNTKTVLSTRVEPK